MISKKFSETTKNVFGKQGEQWLTTLSSLIDDYAQRWGLKIEQPFDLSFNYVVGATRIDGSAAVLKLGVPNGEIRSEIAAMRLYDGNGAARLLEADEEACVFLLERVYPGETIADWDDEAATRMAATVMQKLWRPLSSNHPFRHVREWTDGFERMRQRGLTNMFGSGVMDSAEAILRNLESDTTETTLLHGDLHHWNILTAERAEALVIDPKGMAGDRAYDVGAFLRNLTEKVRAEDSLPNIMRRRIEIFSEMLGFSRQRIAAYGYAQAILSAWWTVEDNMEGWENTLDIATAIKATNLI